uniref:Peptidase S1 domain-containing protein n=1 Tax=Gouania willdenowi TaxID=441366 RepID=A0A8C5N8F4_GOUWI
MSLHLFRVTLEGLWSIKKAPLGSSQEWSVLALAVLGPISQESTPGFPDTSLGSTPTSNQTDQALHYLNFIYLLILYMLVFNHMYAIFSHSSSPDFREWTVNVGRQLSNDFELSLSVTNISITNMSSSNIALIQLTKPVSFSDYVQPLCVDINDDLTFPSGTECWVTGWLMESRRKRKGSFSAN